jgi:hypothetical protein
VIAWLVACIGRIPIPGDTDGDVADSIEHVVDTDVHVVPDTADTDPVVVVPPVPDVVVDCAGGGDFATIAAAIAASRSGTHIGLAPCTYDEDVDFVGKQLDIFGMAGSAVTTIRGAGVGPAVVIAHGEALGTRLAGVTVTGGTTDGYGSGLYAVQAVVALDDVEFVGNDGGYAVLYAYGSSLELTDVQVYGNRVDPGGAVALFDNGSVYGTRVRIDAGRADLGVYEHASVALIDSAIVGGNQAGIYVGGGELHLRGSRVDAPGVGIYAEDYDDTRNERLWLFHTAVIGGDVGVYAGYMHVKADNDVFSGAQLGLDLQFGHAESYVTNTAAIGGLCGIRTDGAAYQLGWNAVGGAASGCGYAGFGTVTDPPGFVDAPEDLALAPGSPLIDAGDPDDDHDDADGTRNDIGVYGGPGGWAR